MNGAKKDWVVIANSSYVEFFELDGRKIIKIETIEYPKGRLKGSEIVSDRPGRGFESSGSGTRHALTSQVDPHQHEQQVFAHKIAQLLKKAKDTNKYERLHLIAPPVFLGILRDVLQENVIKSIHQEINKDISPSLSENERIECILKYLNIEKIAGASSTWKKETQKGRS